MAITKFWIFVGVDIDKCHIKHCICSDVEVDQ